MKMLIKTKGGHEQGLGDVVGSIAIANEALAQKYEVKIALEGEKPAVDLVRGSGINWIEIDSLIDFFRELNEYLPEVVLLNQLNSPLDFVKEIKKRDIFVVTVDDVGPAASIADIRFNPEYHIPDAYCGHKYIPLKSEFKKVNLESRALVKEVRHLLVSLGGSDTYGFTPKVVRALSNLPETTRVTIITGPSFQHRDELNCAIQESSRTFQIAHNVENMISLMCSADVAISSAGLTLFELACVGTPVVIICAERFEEETAVNMEKNGFGINLGFGRDVSEKNIFSAVKMLMHGRRLREKMSKTGKEIVDGNGAARIIDIITKNMNTEVHR